MISQRGCPRTSAMRFVPIFAITAAALAQPRPFEAIVQAARATTPRVTEADVEVLRDGRLLLAYTEFTGGDGSDWGAARIAARTSRDNGRSWGPPRTLVANSGKMNVMDANLLRLKSGRLALAYNRKNSMADCRIEFRTSGDEGETWTEPVTVTTPVKYWGTNNDRLVQLRSGRILMPVFFVDDWAKSQHTRNAVFYSDDQGATWRQSSVVDIVNGKRGADEPGVIELKDGRVLQIVRSDLGQIYRSISNDGGATWSEPEPMGLTAPTAPSSIARIPSTGDLLMVWNNNKPGVVHTQDRFPLTTAISQDDGQTWKQVRNLDETAGFTFAYTSITFLAGNEIVFTYYAERAKRYSLKEKIVPVSWLYAEH